MGFARKTDYEIARMNEEELRAYIAQLYTRYKTVLQERNELQEQLTRQQRTEEQRLLTVIDTIHDLYHFVKEIESYKEV